MNKYLTKLAPFKTASIIPAVNAAQFSFPVEKKIIKVCKISKQSQQIITMYMYKVTVYVH